MTLDQCSCLKYIRKLKPFVRDQNISDLFDHLNFKLQRNVKKYFEILRDQNIRY